MKCQVRGTGFVAQQLVGVLARHLHAARPVRRTGRHWRRGRPRPLTVPSLGWNQWHNGCTCRQNRFQRSISQQSIGGLPQKRQSSTTTSVLRDAAELSIILRSDRSQQQRLFERQLSNQERDDAALELSEALHKLDAKAKLLSLEELSVAAEIAGTSGIWRSGSQMSAAGILGTIVSETRLRWECDGPVTTEPSQPGGGEHDRETPVDVASASARDPESMSRWPTAAAHTESIVRFSRAAGAAMLHAALQARLSRSAASDPDSSAPDVAPPPEEAEWLAAFAASGIAAAARNIPEARLAKYPDEIGRQAASAGHAGTADLRAVAAALQALSPQRILAGACDGSVASVVDDDAGSVVEVLHRDRQELLSVLNRWIGPFYVGAARAVASGLGRLRSKATVYTYMTAIGRGHSREANDLKGGLGDGMSPRMHLLAGREAEPSKVGTVEGVQLAADLGKCMLEARKLVSEVDLPRPSPRLVTRTGPFSPWASLSRIVRWSLRAGASSEIAQRGGHVLALPLAEVILTLRAAAAATAQADLAPSGPQTDVIHWPADPELQLLALPAIIGSNAPPDDDVAHPPGVLTRAIGAMTSWIGSQLGVRAFSISPRAVTAPRLYAAIHVWPSSQRDRVGTESKSEPGNLTSVRAPPPRQRQDAMQLLLDLTEESASKLVREWAASADSLNTSRDDSTLCMLRPPEHGIVTENHFGSSVEEEGASDSTSAPIPFWDLGPLDKSGGSGAPQVEAVKATKPDPADTESTNTEEHSKTIAKPKWLEQIGPLGGALAGDDGLSSQGADDGAWEEADPRGDLAASVLSAASEIIPSDLAAALLGCRRDDESLVGVSPVYSATDIRAAIDTLSQEEDKAPLEDAVQEPVTRVKVRIGPTGDEPNSDSCSQQGQGHSSHPDARLQDVKIRGPFAILRRFRSGLGAGVDSQEGEQWVLQWSTPGTGSEGALAHQREGRMPWEAEFDFEWSAPEDSNRAEPKHPAHVRRGATATGILPDPAGISSQADPLFVPPSVLAGVQEEDFTRESDARAGSKFGPGRRHGHSLRYRTRSAILDLARQHAKDSVDATTLARHMEAVVGMGEDELERWMLDDDSEAVGMARARHVLECLEADELTASNSTHGHPASTWAVSSAASTLAAAENDHSRTGEGNGLDVRNRGIALGPGSQRIALAWRDITLDAVSQQGERFPELAELPEDSRGDGRVRVVEHKGSKAKSSWSRNRSWIAAERMLRQHLGLPKEHAPRVRLMPADSREHGSGAGLSLDGGDNPQHLDEYDDDQTVPGGSPDTVSLVGTPTRSPGPSEHLAMMVLQLAAGQLQTNGRAAAEHSLRMACSVPDAALEQAGRGSIHAGTDAGDGLPAGAGHELLRHADDETLVATGCDIAAWYGADATPTLRHAVHCIADELLAVRGPRLAKENRGLLVEALRGLRPVSAGSWSPHGVDIVAERQVLCGLQHGTDGSRRASGEGGDAASSGSLSYLLRPVGSGPPGYEPDGSSTGEIPGRTNANGEWVPMSPAATGAQPQLSVVAASGARRCLQAICSAVATNERCVSSSANEHLADELLAWGAANGCKLARSVHPSVSGPSWAASQLRTPLDSLDQRRQQDLLECSLGNIATGFARGRGPSGGQMQGYDRVPLDVAELILSYVRDCARSGTAKQASEHNGIPMSRIKLSLGGGVQGQQRPTAHHATTASQCDLALDAIRSARQRSLEAHLESYPDVNLPCEVVQGWRRHIERLSGSSDLDLQDFSDTLGPLGSAGAAISNI